MYINDEPELFYVRKDRKSGLYQDEDGYLVEFNKAARYRPSLFKLLCSAEGFKEEGIFWSGPHMEGEEP